MSTRKEQTRNRIIEAAGKGIRENGYGGIGVDGIAKAAGVTSGAIYGHFGSKDKVFEASVDAGMKDFVNGVQLWQQQNGSKWLNRFIDWYLSEERRQDICTGCALPGLSADVARAGQNVHLAYQDQLRALVDVIVAGLTGGTNAVRKKMVYTLLSLLAGAVTLSRAVDDSKLASQIANAARLNAKKLVADFALENE